LPSFFTQIVSPSMTSSKVTGVVTHIQTTFACKENLKAIKTDKIKKDIFKKRTKCMNKLTHLKKDTIDISPTHLKSKYVSAKT